MINSKPVKIIKVGSLSDNARFKLFHCHIHQGAMKLLVRKLAGSIVYTTIMRNTINTSEKQNTTMSAKRVRI